MNRTGFLECPVDWCTDHLTQDHLEDDAHRTTMSAEVEGQSMEVLRFVASGNLSFHVDGLPHGDDALSAADVRRAGEFLAQCAEAAERIEARS